jgi:hypothetical protein
MGSVFSQPHIEPEGRRWVPVAIGVCAIALVLIAVFVFGRPSAPPPQAATDPYAENLQVADLKLSQAENFAGGTISYLDGKVANVGKLTVTGATVESIFRNSLGEIVQRETQPLRVTKPGLAGFEDVAPLSKVPLTPNTTLNFRLTFEHISNDWNHGYPELRFTQIKTGK